MSDILLTELTIENILKQWPETVEVFRRYSSSCVGCAIAPFCRISDAVKYYGLPQDEFLSELRQVIEREALDVNEV